MRDLPDFKEGNGNTPINLDFDKTQSFFIVFRNVVEKKDGSSRRNFNSWKDVAILEG